MNIEIAGENSLIIYFAEQASSHSSIKVQVAVQKIKRQFNELVIDIIPSYASVLITFKPLKTDFLRFKSLLESSLNLENIELNTPSKLIELPAYYSEDVGPDLKRIALYHQISVADVIRIHQQVEYRVYAIGFSPGFAYLGNVVAKIAMPRLSTPRKNVPRGAIAIADKQTAVYPSSSPGGWNVIGLCPTPMFNAEQQPHMLLKVGDRVKFVGVNKYEFLKLGGNLDVIQDDLI